MRLRHMVIAITGVATLFLYPSEGADPPNAPGVVRVGIIGLDTSHAVEFTKLLNDPKASGDLAGVRVVAAFPAGSPDIEQSRTRIGQITTKVRDMGVEIVDSIPALLGKVDAVLLESVDGRPHLQQARPVFEAGKPLFIDKPLAGSLADVIAIQRLGEKYNVPWFSSSALRFGPSIGNVLKDPSIGPIIGCNAWSPSPLEEHHPDLFWYGIHGVELLYRVMGPGCESVTRTHTDGTDCVTGRWKDGRLGTFRGIRQGKEDYGIVIFGNKRITPIVGFGGYLPLVEQIAVFFKTRKPPVSAEETIELYAFMEAADESKRQGGKPVEIRAVLQRARREAPAADDRP